LPIEKFDLEQAVFIITAENGPFLLSGHTRLLKLFFIFILIFVIVFTCTSLTLSKLGQPFTNLKVELYRICLLTTVKRRIHQHIAVVLTAVIFQLFSVPS
jgi:hypothetical protein